MSRRRTQRERGGARGRLAALLSMALAALAAMAGVLAGCAGFYRRDADRRAYAIVEEAQRRALGRTEPFTIDRPAETLRRRLLLDQDLPRSGPVSLGPDEVPRVKHWPDKKYSGRAATADEPPWRTEGGCTLTLAQALAVAARNNRSYQSQKEDVFRTALALDLEANEFRSLLFAGAEGTLRADHDTVPTTRGLAGTGTADWERKLKTGTLLTAGFAIDLTRLLTQDGGSSLGLLADATITMPLLRGAGAHIVTEPLTQAERDVAYALWDFARFKRTLAVTVASAYLGVLRQLDELENAEANYRRLQASTRRARRLAEAGRLPRIQVDQSLQDELRARDRWVAARQSYQQRLDSLKLTLGLPTDAKIDLDRGELDRLSAVAEALRGGDDAAGDDGPDGATADGGPLEIDEGRAIRTALSHRLDLRTALGQVVDAQRKAVVAADALNLGLSLTGTAQWGERRGVGATGENAQLRLARGVYNLGVELDLPLERTAERNAWRNSLISFERAVRSAQELEDQIKQDVRQALRQLRQQRESYRIQARAVTLAQRRVTSTDLFLQAGRAAIRDVLEAQDALLSAQNARTAALVSYRIAELQLQRDMGVLEVDAKGNWREYEP